MDLAKLDRRRFLGAAGCLPFVTGCPACARSLYDAPSGRATGRNLRDIVSGSLTDRRTADEYADMARTLSEIEDRLYRKGEYAPANVASVKGGAR